MSAGRPPATPPRPRFWIVLLVNLGLGIPGVVPVFMAWYLLVNWPLAALGLTREEVPGSDSVLPGPAELLPLVLAAVAVWFVVNLLLLRRLGLARTWWWIAAALLPLLPYLALQLFL
ncbi:hypothetical protein ACQ3I4_04965 [Zafaria sp. Z1313]|uniref:hypothetical protein n=1 Tax=unclassified Zafaria TaxID=2828765 RepID=UPI002E77907C|nr:hypothetical protein [Zafaria sp. J156]MEE1622318.1 hypothetical protein [Zafaria sp. J156]